MKCTEQPFCGGRVSFTSNERHSTCRISQHVCTRQVAPEKRALFKSGAHRQKKAAIVNTDVASRVPESLACFVLRHKLFVVKGFQFYALSPDPSHVGRMCKVFRHFSHVMRVIIIDESKEKVVSFSESDDYSFRARSGKTKK